MAAALAAIPALSQDTNQDSSADTSTKTPQQSSNQRWFKEQVTAVDTNAVTLSLKKITLHVTSDTKIYMNSQPASLADVKVGSPIGGFLSNRR